MTDEPVRSGDRATGLILVIASVLSIAAMTHHPSTGASGTAERLAETAREATLAGWVHGLLIALMLLIFWGLLRFAGGLHGGWSSSRTQIGAVAYAVGVVCMIGAAAVSGFVVPGLAAHYAEQAPEVMEGAVPILRLCFEVNQALARIGAVAMSAAILLWSWVLAASAAPRWGRALGAFGLLVGAFPVLGLLTGSLELDVHGMLAVIVAQAAWTIGVGVWHIQRTRGRTDA